MERFTTKEKVLLSVGMLTFLISTTFACFVWWPVILVVARYFGCTDCQE